MDTESSVCSSCGNLISPYVDYCPKCLSPTAATFNLDPINAIETEGHLLVRAAQGRQKPIVLIGIWILFLPVFLSGLLFAISILGEGISSGMANFVFFWVAIGLAFIGFTVLYKVTKNYFGWKPPTEDENGEITELNLRT